ALPAHAPHGDVVPRRVQPQQEDLGLADCGGGGRVEVSRPRAGVEVRGLLPEAPGEVHAAAGGDGDGPGVGADGRVVTAVTAVGDDPLPLEGARGRRQFVGAEAGEVAGYLAG